MQDTTIQSSRCFVCGKDNPRGLKVPFKFHGDRVTAEFAPSRELCGFDGIVHGGILFSLADEAMMHLIHGSDIKAITAEVTIRMINFALAENPLFIESHSLNRKNHLVTCKAVLRNEGLEVICKASGKFLYYNESQPFKKSGL